MNSQEKLNKLIECYDQHKKDGATYERWRLVKEILDQIVEPLETKFLYKSQYCESLEHTEKRLEVAITCLKEKAEHNLSLYYDTEDLRFANEELFRKWRENIKEENTRLHKELKHEKSLKEFWYQKAKKYLTKLGKLNRKKRNLKLKGK